MQALTLRRAGQEINISKWNNRSDLYARRAFDVWRFEVLLGQRQMREARYPVLPHARPLSGVLLAEQNQKPRGVGVGCRCHRRDAPAAFRALPRPNVTGNAPVDELASSHGASEEHARTNDAAT
jgi:hypothetical protein